MDYVLLQKHIVSNSSYEPPMLNEDGSNLCDFFCADVVGNRRFAQNYGGYPRSEIAEINAQASMQQAVNLFNDLIVHEGSYQSADLTPEEIMLSHKSKYCQSASEMISYIDSQLALRDAKYGQPLKPKEGTISFKENEEKSVDNA